MTIDIHTHIWKEGYKSDLGYEAAAQYLAKVVNEWLGGVDGKEISAKFALENLFPKLMDPDGSKSIKRMDEAGIEISALFPVDAGLVWGDGKIGIEEYNEWMADIAKRYPGRFIFFYGIDPRRKNAIKMFEKSITNLNAKGLKLYPLSGFYLDDKVVYPFYSVCQEADLPVLTHLGPQTSIFKVKCGTPLRMKQVLIDFPKLKIIGAHLAEELWPDLLAIGKEFPNVYADISGHQLDTKEKSTHFAHVLRRFLNEMGPDRIMWGTDAPFFEPIVSAKEWLELIKSLPEVSKNTDKITEAEVEAVLDGNARKLLGIG